MTDLKKLYQSDLPKRAIAVYLYLRGRANKEGFCWPAIPTMARELKMSESTIRRALRDLVREGFLVIEERQRDYSGTPWDTISQSSLFGLSGSTIHDSKSTMNSSSISPKAFRKSCMFIVTLHALQPFYSLVFTFLA